MNATLNKERFYKNLENRVSFLENKFNKAKAGAGVHVKIFKKKTKK